MKVLGGIRMLKVGLYIWEINIAERNSNSLWLGNAALKIGF